MSDKEVRSFCNPYHFQQPQETPYNGNPHDTRRVYTEEETKRLYSPFFPSIEDLLKW